MRNAVRAALVLAVLLALAACSGGSGNSGTATTLPSAATTSLVPGASTTAPFQTSGVRTVLSPIGLRVRAQPSTTAQVLGSAAEGSTLTVTGHTDQGGGWYQVMGATVNSGYIKDDPTLSAPGMFMSFSAGDDSFAGLAPSGWNNTSPSTSVVVLQAATGSDSITVASAAAMSGLGQNKNGYRATKSTTMVVCGVTGQLVTYARSSGSTPGTTASNPGTTAPTVALPTTTVAGAPTTPAGAPPAPPVSVIPEQYLLQIHLTLDPKHVLAVDAYLADLSTAAAVQAVVSSLSFPFPQCQGGPPPGATTTPTT